MAKKKSRQEPKKETSNYNIELIGCFLVVIALIGIIQTGPAGIFVANFGVFLFGTWYIVFLLSLIITGIYMIIKRKKPDFLTQKLIGIYIIFLGVLVLSHVKYISNTKLEGFEIIKETLTIFMQTVSKRVELSNIGNVCGGVLGASLVAGLKSLFAVPGTIIITITLMIVGIVLLTNISMADLFSKIICKLKSKKHDSTKEAHIVSKETTEENEEKENKDIEEEPLKERTVVLSLKDLRRFAKDIKEEPKEIIKEHSEIINENIEIEKKNNYIFPSISLLKGPNQNSKNVESKETITKNSKIIEQVLRDFNIVGEVIYTSVGPAVTQYEMHVKSGTKVSKISSLNKEIALALAAKNVRIEAPIPGKSTIGIEIPNKVTSMVTVREILETIPANMKDSKLLVTLGKNIMGKPVYCEINKTPHLLVAGSTGSGKSVCINSIIISILMRTKPEEVKLVLVDPKKVELSMYNCIPHLLTPVVTDPKKANEALKRIVQEMEDRYEKFSETGTKNISGYNEYIEKHNQKGEGKMPKLPFIVVIIDELADLMLVAAKEVEDSIMRITQMARAAGIHLIVATQRPSTDVITGVVKANIPSRISFAVSSGIDSRTILDMIGAEKLLGKGDMLFLPQGENTPIRVQGTFLSDEEIKKVVDHTIKQQKAKYDARFEESELKGTTTMVNDSDAFDEPLYDEMVEFIIQSRKASTSSLQRRFKIGFNRAARAMDLLEERGIVGASVGSKPREVLINKEDE